MLNLKIADLYADLTISMATFNRQLGQIHNRLSSFKPPPIVVNANTSAATARLNLLLQQLKAVQAQAATRVNVGVGAGRMGRGGGSRGGGPGLMAGVGEGLGLGYMANPAMAAGAAVGAGVKEAIGAAIDLESKFAEVRRVVGISADETGRLKSELMKISTIQPGASLDDLIKMANIGGRMGLAGKDLTTFASGLATVKNAVDGMETEHLAEGISKVLGVFQLGPEYIRGFGSALAKLDQVTKASAAEILNVSTRLAGTAQAVGVSLPEVMAISAAMIDVGISAEVAGSSMSQIFRRMATNSKAFAAAAGVNAAEFEAAYRRGPIEALTLLMTKLGEEKDPIKFQETLKTLGLTGVRTAGTIQQLGGSFGKLADLIKTANGEFASLKSLMAADALKGETTAAALGKLQNAATGFADAIGGKMLPDLKALTDGLTEMARAANAGGAALDRASQRNVPKALDWIANHTPTGMVMKSLTDMANESNAARGAPASFGKFNAFQRFSDMLLGKAAPVPPAPPPAKPPGLPTAKEPVGPPSPFTGPGGSGVGKPWGIGPLGEALKGRLGTAGFIGKTLLGAVGQDLKQIPTAIGANLPNRPGQVGLNATSFGQQLQADILKGKKDDEQLKETRNLGTILGEIRGLLSKAGTMVPGAVLGPP